MPQSALFKVPRLCSYVLLMKSSIKISISEIILIGSPKELGDMFVKMQLFPPQIPYGLAYDRIGASTMRDRLPLAGKVICSE
jgi:hypothetical protein